jgi:hypothetical protein
MKTIAIISLLLAVTVAGWGQLLDQALTTDGKSQVEMAIAVSPLDGNKLFGVWADFSTTPPYPTHIGWSYSTDGGHLWSSNSSYSPLTPSIGGTSYNYISDCSASFDRYGNVFIVCMAAADYASRRSATIMLAKSSLPPTATSWSYTWIDSYIVDDKPYLAVNNTGGQGDGDLHVTWTNITNPGTAILHECITGRGTVFGTPEQLASATGNVVGTRAASYISLLPLAPDPVVSYVQFSEPAIGPDGALYVTWTLESPYGNTTNASVVYLKKLPYGGSWSDTIRVANCTYLNTAFGSLKAANNPSLAVAAAELVNDFETLFIVV